MDPSPFGRVLLERNSEDSNNNSSDSSDSDVSDNIEEGRLKALFTSIDDFEEKNVRPSEVKEQILRLLKSNPSLAKITWDWEHPDGESKYTMLPFCHLISLSAPGFGGTPTAMLQQVYELYPEAASQKIKVSDDRRYNDRHYADDEEEEDGRPIRYLSPMDLTKEFRAAENVIQFLSKICPQH